MQVFTFIFSSVFIFLTLLPFIKSGYWWIRVFDYPRMQITFFLLISVALAIGYLDLNHWSGISCLTLLCVSIVYQISLICRYTPIYPVQAKKAVSSNAHNTLRIVESNVRMENKKCEKIITMVKEIKPDVLIVNEPNSWWAEQIKEFDQIYKYSVKKPLENTYGMMLYSKFPLKNIETNFLVSDEIPSIFSTVTMPSGVEVDLYCLHPKPPMPGSPTYERDTEILLVGKKVKKTNRASIVIGDLNDVAWSHTSSLFQRYSGLLDPRQGRGMFNTYNVFLPGFRYPLDHFFYSNHFGLKKLQRLKSVGSDHFPMLLEIVYEENVNHIVNKTKSDIEDVIEVEETLTEAKEEIEKMRSDS